MWSTFQFSFLAPTRRERERSLFSYYNFLCFRIAAGIASRAWPSLFNLYSKKKQNIFCLQIYSWHLPICLTFIFLFSLAFLLVDSSIVRMTFIERVNKISLCNGELSQPKNTAFLVWSFFRYDTEHNTQPIKNTPDSKQKERDFNNSRIRKRKNLYGEMKIKKVYLSTCSFSLPPSPSLSLSSYCSKVSFHALKCIRSH